MMCEVTLYQLGGMTKVTCLDYCSKYVDLMGSFQEVKRASLRAIAAAIEL